MTISVALRYLPAVFQSSEMDKRRQTLSHFNSGLHQLCRVCQEVMPPGHRQQQPVTHPPATRKGRQGSYLVVFGQSSGCAASSGIVPRGGEMNKVLLS